MNSFLYLLFLIAEQMGHFVVPSVSLRVWDCLPVRKFHRPRLLIYSNNGQVMGSTGLVSYLSCRTKRLEFYSFFCLLKLSFCIPVSNSLKLFVSTLNTLMKVVIFWMLILKFSTLLIQELWRQMKDNFSYRELQTQIKD